MENWRPIRGFEGRYEVSDLGRVRSLMSRFDTARTEPRIPKPTTHSAGYKMVTLTDGSGSGHKTVLVHRAVMEAFVGPCPAGLEVCHNDGDPSNAALSNLRYDTHKSNCADQNAHGTHRKGTRNGRSKLSGEQIGEIRRRRVAGETLKTIAGDYGVSLQQIHNVTSGKSWTHVDKSRMIEGEAA